MVKRVEIIIYFQHKNDTRKYLESIGLNVQYINKKMGYAVVYADEANLGRTINGIKRLRGFKRYDIQDTELVSFSLAGEEEVKETPKQETEEPQEENNEAVK
ncbi:MAG: YlbG family protein [Gammaproteobacteria bacterium]|nr:YlbG family protein [Gammaproteobacteria bacterium]